MKYPCIGDAQDSLEVEPDAAGNLRVKMVYAGDAGFVFLAKAQVRDLMRELQAFLGPKVKTEARYAVVGKDAFYESKEAALERAKAVGFHVFVTRAVYEVVPVKGAKVKKI